MTVTSGSKLWGENDGEGMLQFEWGADMVLVDGSPDSQTVEDRADLELIVQDDFTRSYLTIGVVVAIIAAAIIGVVILVKMRRRERAGA